MPDSKRKGRCHMNETILTAQGLTKRYGSAVAVDHVDMSIRKGQIYGLIGRNGAGKTSIIRMIAAQSRPTGGTISLFGSATQGQLAAARARIGVMVETPSFYPYLTAQQNLEYYRLQRGIPGKHCVDEALETVGLADVGKKHFKACSLGMKQRLGLGLALMNHPDFLLLDEPINGLDPEGIVEFRNLLLDLNRERKTTILISSHILSELSNLATHYGFLDKGVMLEQISAVQLNEKCRAGLKLTVDNAGKAVLALEQKLGIRDYEVLSGNVILVFEMLSEPQRVTSTLAESGVALSGVESKGSGLEEYFLNLIGGHGHA